MGKIIWVRHGQASFLSENYDKLSDKGIEQAKALGRFWESTGMTFDKVYAGGLTRQQETAFHAYGKLEAHILPAFDEHEGPVVMDGTHGGSFQPADDPEEMRRITRHYFRTYQQLTRQWIKEELSETFGAEPWTDFRSRVKAGFQEVLDRTGKGENIAIFTSGGTVAAAVGQVLGLAEEQTLELSWQVKNASFTEFLYSSGRLTLNTFNETPHLALAGLQSMI
ncbi:MAG: histidine phosphatase family protein [Bacteroidota bacterium]